MRAKASAFFLFVMLAATAASADTKPVDTTQLAAWLAGGVPSSRLIRLVKEQGLATVARAENLHQLESCGADPALIHFLSEIEAQTPGAGTPIPNAVVKAAVAIHQQNAHQAELLLRAAVTADNNNSALHFALGATLRQQEQWEWLVR